MEKLNDYIWNVFNLINQSLNKGLIEKPKKYRLNKKDKKVLNNIYNLDKLYIKGITPKEFRQISINYSINTGENIITSGLKCSTELKKIIENNDKSTES